MTEQRQPRMTAATDRFMRGVWRLAVLLMIAAMFEPNSHIQQGGPELLTVFVLFAGGFAIIDILLGAAELAEIGWRQAKGVET